LVNIYAKATASPRIAALGMPVTIGIPPLETNTMAGWIDTIKAKGCWMRPSSPDLYMASSYSRQGLGAHRWRCCHGGGRGVKYLTQRLCIPWRTISCRPPDLFSLGPWPVMNNGVYPANCCSMPGRPTSNTFLLTHEYKTPCFGSKA